MVVAGQRCAVGTRHILEVVSSCGIDASREAHIVEIIHGLVVLEAESDPIVVAAAFRLHALLAFVVVDTVEVIVKHLVEAGVIAVLVRVVEDGRPFGAFVVVVDGCCAPSVERPWRLLEVDARITASESALCDHIYHRAESLVDILGRRIVVDVDSGDVVFRYCLELLHRGLHTVDQHGHIGVSSVENPGTSGQYGDKRDGIETFEEVAIFSHLLLR